MKIFSAEQIREWDLYTIHHEPIESIELMERASQKCTDWLIHAGFDDNPIKIFCGKGNNGGDGLAIARQLAEQGIFSRIYILEFGNPGTPDFQANLHRLHQHTTEIYYIQDVSFFPVIKREDVVIDALYGSGVNRPLEGLSSALVDYINRSEAGIISIDIPSGMFVDRSSKGNTVIKAAHTLTFQVPKLCFLLPENEAFVGELHVFDIGLHSQFEIDHSSSYVFADRALIRTIYRPRSMFSHKGSFGHALIIGGSKGKLGAAYLASKGCLRSGAGLLTALVPPIGLQIMQTSLPEAMCLTMEDSEPINYDRYAAIGIGPGLGTDRVEYLKQVIQAYQKPVVFDADALNILAQNESLLSAIPPNSILTPHPKEYERLFGKTLNDFERLKNALENAKKRQCYIIIKGHYTFIACPEGKGFFNSTGNPGMATGGSGDVLTGIITSLLAQTYTSEEACILGVYLHGLAGDLAADDLSQEAMTAGDLAEYLGQAFKTINV